MNNTRQIMNDFFELPFHKRIEIAKKMDIYNENDLKLSPLESTQKWGKKIINAKQT